MAEWLKAHAWKACLGETLTRVRIPLSPPFIFNNLEWYYSITYRLRANILGVARLKLYRRHLAKCQHKAKGNKFDRCKCPIWIRGTWAGEAIRKSLDVDSWAKAEVIKDEIEHGKQVTSITVKEALAAWVKDCESRNLAKNTLRKYRSLQGHLTEWAERQHLSRIGELQTDMVKLYRESRNLGPRTSSKELGFLRAFFNFAIENGWITKNPAKAIKAPQVKTLPRIPFSEKEIQNILGQAQDDRELAFLLTLRHTGLRIGDASLLRVSQLSEQRIFLYTTKAGTPVSILIPDNLVSLLKALPAKGGYFFIRGESIHQHTAPDLWRKRIKAICKELKIVPDHPHRFRHSLAADLLTKGATVEQVAAILGNSPAVVIKHYSQWIKSRQDALDRMIEKTWEKPALTLVKK